MLALSQSALPALRYPDLLDTIRSPRLSGAVQVLS